MTQNDIDSLNAEINSLTQELETLKNQHVQIEKSIANEIQSNRKRIDDVPIVQHSYFDESISKYFSEFKPKPKPQLSIDNFNKIVALKENILYENLYRLSGITAFPLNRSFDPDCHYLGVRFDILSSISKTFNTIHYVILRLSPPLADEKLTKVSDTLKYSVYRSTCLVPSHISSILQFNKPNSELVQTFTKALRKTLILDQLHSDFEGFINDLSFRQLDIPLDGQVFRSIVKFDNGFSISNSDYLIEVVVSDDGLVMVKSMTCFNGEAKCGMLLRGFEFGEFRHEFGVFLQKLYL